jgi:hypothetical protein
MTETIDQLFNDKQVAALLAVSASWVRVQRFNRRQGIQHVFDVDPIQLGTSPRYARSDVEAFMQRLKDASAPTPHEAAPTPLN